MTSVKRRGHARPPSQLTVAETREWRALLTELNRLERGLVELQTLRTNYCGKTDFDLVAQSNQRHATKVEAKLFALEALDVQRAQKKAAP